MLQESNLPLASAFTVTAGGSDVSVTAVGIPVFKDTIQLQRLEPGQVIPSRSPTRNTSRWDRGSSGPSR